MIGRLTVRAKVFTFVVAPIFQFCLLERIRRWFNENNLVWAVDEERISLPTAVEAFAQIRKCSSSYELKKKNYWHEGTWQAEQNLILRSNSWL